MCSGTKYCMYFLCSVDTQHVRCAVEESAILALACLMGPPAALAVKSGGEILLRNYCFPCLPILSHCSTRQLCSLLT